MFQVSDEISYLAGLQQRVYQSEPGTTSYVCASPPDGIPLQVDAGGKRLFRDVGGFVLEALCGSGLPSTVVFWLLRLLCGLTLPLLVLMTFLLAREVLPGQPEAWLAAAGLVALQPIAATVAGGITPDSIVNVLGAATLVLSTRWVLGHARGWEGPAMAATALAAVATKDNAAFLVPTVAVAVVSRVWLGTRARAGRVRLASIVLMASGLAAWAVFRFLPPTTVSGEALRAGPSAWALGPASLVHASDQLWSLVWSTWMPLGNFGASTLQLSQSLVVLPVLFAGLVAVGAATAVLDPNTTRLRRVAPLWVAALLLCLVQPAVREAVLQVPDAYQGRWAFPMLSAMAVLATVGAGGLGVRIQRTLPLWLVVLATVAGLALILVAGHYYTVFPARFDDSHLFLRSSSGVPLEMAKLSLWVERPVFLRESLPFYVAGLLWLTATGVATIAAARLTPGRPDPS
ncbi:hypothetical protein [Luteitalea sp.]